MAIRERKVKNKRNSQGILTGRSGIVYDVNVKVYENGRQKSIAKRGFATRREAELYEAQIKLELQTGSKIMAIPTEPAKAAGKGKTAPVTER